jgi:hypothetical protein
MLFFDIYMIIINNLDDQNKMNMRLVNKYFRDFRFKLFKRYLYKENLIIIFDFTRLYCKTCIEDNIYLSSLNYIYFDEFFDDNIDNLPQNVTEIIFHVNSRFNKKVDNLPRSLKVLILGIYFNQTVDCLPQTLTTLFLCGFFYQSIDNLPDSLISLTLIPIYYKREVRKYPRSLKSICINTNIIKLINPPKDLIIRSL